VFLSYRLAWEWFWDRCRSGYLLTFAGDDQLSKICGIASQQFRHLFPVQTFVFHWQSVRIGMQFDEDVVFSGLGIPAELDDQLSHGANS
jgi:hypothetical protein